MKKLIYTFIPLLLLCAANAYAREAVTVFVNCGMVTVYGTGRPDSTVMCAVTGQSGRTVFFDDCESDVNGAFLFPVFAMPDVENPDESCFGEYTAAVNLGWGEVNHTKVRYYGLKAREGFIKKFNAAKDEGETETLLRENKELISEFGISPNSLNLTDMAYESLFNALPLPSEEAMFAERLRELILLDNINNTAESELAALLKENAFSGIDIVFEEKDITENEEMLDFICTYLKDKKFTSIKSLNEKIKDGAILYTVSNEGKQSLGDALKKYGKVIGIDDVKMTKYTKSETVTLSINSYILRNIPGGGFKSFESFLDVFDKAVIMYTEEKESTGGGKTGGTGQTAAVIPKQDIKTENVAFSDVGSVLWAMESIEYLRETDIISGDGNGEFRPNEFVTREEFVKMLVCLLKISPRSFKNEFTDVKQDAWYFGYIGAAVKYGIINGVSKDLFGTGCALTRQDAAVMLKRACVHAGISVTGSGSIGFSDSDEIADYAKESVQSLCSGGIITGFENNTFAPGANLTRAQAAKLLYGVIKYEKGGGK